MSALIDRDLMLFADGELDEGERRRVLALLGPDRAAQSKLAALRLTGELLRESVEAPPLGEHPADGIADAVMAALDLSGGASPTMPAGEPVEAPAPPPPAPVVSLAERRSRVAAPAIGPASSAKRIYSLAAVAVAAAAALAIWARAPVGEHAQLATEADPPASPLPVEAAPSSLAAAAAVAEDDGAEVTAVDFGTRTGSIFYVPSQALASNVVAVVWINDDPTGGTL